MKHLVELHLHLDGSVRPETVWELAQKQGVKLPADNIEDLRHEMQVPDSCQNLVECLKRFDVPLLVMQEADAIERMTFELVEDLADIGVDYAEIRFAPQLSTKKGLTQDEIVEAAIRGAEAGMKKYPQIRVGLILCCMRLADNKEDNFQTVETAKKYLGDVVCAVDLAGAESLYPNGLYGDLFAKMREYGLPMTIHSGEALGAEKGPQSVRDAIAGGARRLGHGVNSVYDEELMDELAKLQIPLEICVTSNVQAHEVASLEESPIRKFFDRGIKVTVNSDNMTVSNLNILSELEMLKKVHGFTDEEIEKLEENAYESRFLK